MLSKISKKRPADWRRRLSWKPLGAAEKRGQANDLSFSWSLIRWPQVDDRFFVFGGFHLDACQKQNVGSILHLVSGVGFQPNRQKRTFLMSGLSFLFQLDDRCISFLSGVTSNPMTGQRPLWSSGSSSARRFRRYQLVSTKESIWATKKRFISIRVHVRSTAWPYLFLVHCWAIQLNNDLTRTPRVAARQLKRRKADGRMEGPPWKSSTVSSAARQMAEIKRQGTKYAPSHEMAAHLWLDAAHPQRWTSNVSTVMDMTETQPQASNKWVEGRRSSQVKL